MSALVTIYTNCNKSCIKMCVHIHYVYYKFYHECTLATQKMFINEIVCHNIMLNSELYNFFIEGILFQLLIQNYCFQLIFSTNSSINTSYRHVRQKKLICIMSNCPRDSVVRISNYEATITGSNPAVVNVLKFK